MLLGAALPQKTAQKQILYRVCINGSATKNGSEADFVPHVHKWQQRGYPGPARIDVSHVLVWIWVGWIWVRYLSEHLLEGRHDAAVVGREILLHAVGDRGNRRDGLRGFEKFRV